VSSYAFEEDELRRVSAFKRWRLWLNVVVATIRLRLPLRKHARLRKSWKRAAHVAAAANRFERLGGERAQTALDRQGNEGDGDEDDSGEETAGDDEEFEEGFYDKRGT
jgi:hypothetical protein